MMAQSKPHGIPMSRVMEYQPLMTKLFDLLQGKPGASFDNVDATKLLAMGVEDGLLPADYDAPT